MAMRTGETTPTPRVAPGPRGNVVLGSIGDIYRDRLRLCSTWPARTATSRSIVLLT